MDSTTNISDAVLTARQYHMRTMTEDVSSETDTRRWAQKIVEQLERENLQFVDFLWKPAEEFPSISARKEFLRKLADPALNSHASWFDTYLKRIPNENGQLDRDIERTFESSKIQIDKIMDVYKRSLIDLFHYDTLMAKKLKLLERKQSDLLRLYEFDDKTEQSRALQKSILDYLHHVYDENKIENDYSEFCFAYTRVMALRSILLPIKRTEDSLHKSLCGICMRKEIEMALVPCGHVCCADCGKKQHSQCYACRSSIREWLRLYF